MASSTSDGVTGEGAGNRSDAGTDAGTRRRPDAPTRPHAAGRGRARKPARTVNWVAFIGTGVVLGVILGGLAHVLGPQVPEYGTRTSILFLAAFGALIGGLAAGVVGAVVETVLDRKARHAGASA